MVFAEIGIDCVALHSMIAQRLRLAALAKFKSSQVKIMIATDVGSRFQKNNNFFYWKIYWAHLFRQQYMDE